MPYLFIVRRYVHVVHEKTYYILLNMNNMHHYAANVNNCVASISGVFDAIEQEYIETCLCPSLSKCLYAL